MKNKKTEQMVKLAFLIALELVLWMTPLGYVPIGVVRATTMHIPVILAGILLGKTQGAVCGFLFGLTSVITNTITPTVTSFVFSPFYAVGGVSGNLYSLLIAFVPRIVLGYGSGWLKELSGEKKLWKVSALSAGMTIVHTLLVMSGIYVFFGPVYAEVRGIAYGALLSVIGGVIVTNGVAEAVLAAVVCTAITAALQKGEYQ